MEKYIPSSMFSKSKRYVFLFLLIFCLLFTACTSVPSDVTGGGNALGDVATMVMKSSAIYTGVDSGTISGAVAIQADKILAVGTMEELEKYIDSETKIIDLGDQMIIPGFIDSHTHSTIAETVLGVDVTFVAPQENVAQVVADFISANPDKEVIIGGGWYAAVWGGADPDKKYLDEVAPNIPVILYDYDHHAIWCNSKALEMAGVDKAYAAKFNKENSGNLISVDANGEPTGYLREAGQYKVSSLMPDWSADDLKYCIDIWSTYGVTSINEMTPRKADNIYYDQIEELERNGLLQTRHMLTVTESATDEQISSLKSRFTSDMARMTSLKIFMDGVGATYTASMLQPYANTTETGGEPYYTAEEFATIVQKADKHGLATHAHVCGDKAVRTALDGYQLAADRGVKLDNRFSLEHMDTVSPEDINRPAALGISLNVTPDFMAPTPTWDSNPYIRVYTAEVAKTLWNYGSLYKSGANVAFSTDSYFSSYNPLVQIYRSIARVTDDGKPLGGYLPEEKFTVHEALECYTINAAKSLGMADKIGTLEKGKYADIVVLDTNILTCETEEIRNAQVILTMLGGKVLYSK